MHSFHARLLNIICFSLFSISGNVMNYTSTRIFRNINRIYTFQKHGLWMVRSNWIIWLNLYHLPYLNRFSLSLLNETRRHAVNVWLKIDCRTAIYWIQFNWRAISINVLNGAHTKSHSNRIVQRFTLSSSIFVSHLAFAFGTLAVATVINRVGNSLWSLIFEQPTTRFQ